MVPPPRLPRRLDANEHDQIPSSFRSSCGRVRGNRATALTNDPTTSERLRFNPPSEPGVMHRRGSFGAVFRYPLTARTSRDLAGRLGPSLVASPDGAHGVWL